MAGSTHAGEEEIAAEVHKLLAVTRRDLLTVIAPRHPQRGHQLGHKNCNNPNNNQKFDERKRATI